MASVSLITSAGGYSSAMPFKVRSVDCVTYAGTAVAIGRVAWGGTDSPLSRVPWIPKAGTPITIDGKVLRPEWDRALRWLFEQYIGGLNAPTVPQITQSVAQTQTQVVAVGVQASAAQSIANSAAESVNTTRQVLINDGTPGAEQIPITQPGSPGSFEP